MTLPAWCGAPPDERDPARAPVRRARPASAEPADHDVLLPRLRAGDADAFEALFRAEYGALHDFAWALCGTRELADEVVSDVFAWLYVHRATVTPKTTIAAYLMGAVRHRAANLRRGVLRAEHRHRALGVEGHASVVPQRPTEPDEALLAREDDVHRARQLARALAPLSQTARSVFVLRVRRGMTYEEIAEAVGISANAAKTQFSRALAVVRAGIGVVVGGGTEGV